MDLLAQVDLNHPKSIVDLGCGTGEITLAIAERWPTADVLGLDSSRTMLEKAASLAGRVQWQLGDIATWKPTQPAHLIYCNASLHWLDDHERLFASLMEHLSDNGCLAVQMPLSHQQKTLALIVEELDAMQPEPLEMSLSRLVEKFTRPWMLDAPDYHRLLAPLSRELRVWVTEYFHALSGPDPVINWLSGTALRPAFKHLAERDSSQLLSNFATAVAKQYPRRSDGTVLLPYKRLFLVAYK